MHTSITPAALEALANEYDELGLEPDLLRTEHGVPFELEYRNAAGVRISIFADDDLVYDADVAARYRDEVDGEAESAWRSQ